MSRLFTLATACGVKGVDASDERAECVKRVELAALPADRR